jgi:hypothetical protein
MMDHGFFQFSPTLFWDFYHANAYEDIKLHIALTVGGLPSRVSIGHRTSARREQHGRVSRRDPMLGAQNASQHR